GPSERQQRTDWADYAIPLVEPPFWDVWAGIDRIINLLTERRLKIHDCCVNLISEIGDYRRVQNKKTGEFTDVIYNKGAYDCLDATRYGVAWLTGGEEMAQVVYRPELIGRQY
ncbi:MAG TPA: hypothetical protein VMY40_00100, partial [Anaerolineae bacterium]|nr:hypothetical protein [Anaerolineae bacterium]